jgi:hypothetical protein
VRDELVARGVDPERLVVASAGYEGTGVNVGTSVVDFYDNDQDAEGVQIEEIARTNRAVHIIPLEDAQEVLERFGG